MQMSCFLLPPILTVAVAVAVAVMHPLIHHHQEILFASIDEPINASIRGAIDNDEADTPNFVDEEGNTTSAVTAEKKVASNLSVFLQRNTTKVRRN
jgi:hypothetical protein